MKFSTMVIVVGGILTSAVVLAGCGGQQGGLTTPSASSSQVFNQADVTFAEQMIVHHQQAIIMADLAQEHAQSPQVKQLATDIKAEQQPEIQTMTGWLQAWGQAPSSTSPTSGMPTPTGMPHMPTTMPSMMPSMTPMPDLSQMMQAHGPQFDHMFLQLMIAHHEDAVAMAKQEQTSGANPDAKQLAKNIETSQTKQITQMQQMLATPSPRPS